MKAVKGNKRYTIKESEKARYQNEGFDIVGDDGKIIAYGKGKTVPYEKYVALEKEVAELKEKAKETVEDSEVFAVLAAYASEHDIDLGKTTTVTGAMKKITAKAGE